jgi:hypothetical protein
MRGLVAGADEELEVELRAALCSGDDHASAAKPQIDWKDTAEREASRDWRCSGSARRRVDGRSDEPPARASGRSSQHVFHSVRWQRAA